MSGGVGEDVTGLERGSRGVDRPRVLDTVGLIARLGLAAIWLISGYLKASAPAETLVAVKAYRLLSPGTAEVVAAVLPYLEIALGLLLLLGLATRLAAVLSALVLLVFIGGVISAAARGLSIDCGCFGGGGDVAAGETDYVGEILRDVGFLVMAGWLVARPWTPWSLDRRLTGR